jgi:hypothetical protein
MATVMAVLALAALTVFVTLTPAAATEPRNRTSGDLP